MRIQRAQRSIRACLRLHAVSTSEVNSRALTLRRTVRANGALDRISERKVASGMRTIRPAT